MSQERRAVILAGGKGTRLRPYTIVLPKPLVPIGEYPILELIVRQLSRSGFDRITVAVNHYADLIMAFFGDGKKWDIKIDYSLEDKPLGTMGPLKLIDDLPENFVVMNGDVLTDLNLGSFLDSHIVSGAGFSVSAFRRSLNSEYGVLDVDEKGMLSGFREKPILAFLVSMGIYCVNREILDLIPEGRPYGFDSLMVEMLARKKGVRVARHGGYWLDIGRPDDYAIAIDEFERIKNVFFDD